MPDALSTHTVSADSFLPTGALNAELCFDHWGYRHASRRYYAVRGLNLTIQAGQRVLLLGASGIGKSTILEGAAGLIGSHEVSYDTVHSGDQSSRDSVEDADGGLSEGCVLVDGVPVRQARGRVGLVLQDPDAQAIFRRLGDNVAFGPENMNVERDEIWRRVDESLAAVGLSGLQLHRSTTHLSGGQMQRLALAGALAMRPSVLLLDEPTANLDPDGVEQIVRAVSNVLETTHATMMLVEHHAEPWIDLIDRVVVLGLASQQCTMNSGSFDGALQDTTMRPEAVHDDDLERTDWDQTVIVADGTPDEVFSRTDLDFEELGIWLPQRYRQSQTSLVQKTIANANAEQSLPYSAQEGNGKLVLSTRDLAIGRNGVAIAEHMNIDFYEGQITALVGANGAGKSTLSLTLAGLLPAVFGQVVASSQLSEGTNSTDPMRWKSPELAQRISYVFQNPEHQFACGSVLEEVMLEPLRTGMSEQEARARALKLLRRFRLDRYSKANPYTLSGGEKRRLTVAASLSAAPRVLILDEPTFGQDRKTWLQIVKLIASLRGEGVSIIVVTHDRELVNALGARLVELTAVCDDTSRAVSSAIAASADSRELQRFTVSAINARDEEEKMSSHSPFLASLNPVYRMFGAFLLSLPLLLSLDWVSATVALVLEFIVLACLKIAPWRVVYLSWPVWVGAPGSALAIWLYGKSGGNTWWQWGMIHVTDRSSALAIATALRILAIGIPAIVTVMGLDATDLADAMSQILHLPDRFVYGGLAGMRLFSVLQDDWLALTASRRSRGLGDEHRIRAFFPQTFALLVLSIRRSTTLATAMEARGFGGVSARSHARVSVVRRRDYLFLIACIILPAVALVTAWYFGTFAFLGGGD